MAMTPEERVKELEDGMVSVQQQFTALTAAHAETQTKLYAANAALATERYRVQRLRAGLAVYRPGPFWDDVQEKTAAAEDRGKYAEWVLRVTADENDPEGA